MPLIPLIGAVAVIASLPLLWWAVSGARPSVSATTNLGRRQWDGLERRKTPRVSYEGAPPVDLRQAMLAHSAKDRAVGPAIERLARRAQRLTPSGMLDKLERRVPLAGGPKAWPMERVLAAKLVLGAGAAVLGGLAFVQV